jgi:large subunit ribosomal protein L23
MNKERMLKVLMSSHVTEKSASCAGDKTQCVFKVASDATKVEVKQAVEKLLKVSVDSVRVCVMKGKTTRFRNRPGKRNNWKKAYVTLSAGSELEVASQA